MAESQELLDRKLRRQQSYLWTWERNHIAVRTAGESDSLSFLGLLQHEKTAGYNGPKYWQNNSDTVCSSETEELSENRPESQNFNEQSSKSENSVERVTESLKSEPSGSAGCLTERTLHVEVQPFAHEPIDGGDLMTAVMGIRCYGLLRWELDPDEPHTPLVLNLLAVVDKDLFDVHNLAAELDQALLNFATCSVAIKEEGCQTNFFLLGGSRSKTPEEITVEKPRSKIKKFFLSKPFFSAFIPLKRFRSSSLRNIAVPTNLSQNGGELMSAMQEITSELKMVRKDIRDIQSHVCFLSRHISNVNLLANRGSLDACDHSHHLARMYGLTLPYTPKSNVVTPNGAAFMAEKPNREKLLRQRKKGCSNKCLPASCYVMLLNTYTVYVGWRRRKSSL
ncbi:unnamed protein product [Allacma fusca]|uniref:Uncharacterized protein n=1 Tax=Allacma fusca TaxID=39272 RepID=A0A8J2KCF4_9HEXA|nr:unnamed protein product [Allacma fusca]